jgi:hypothetical protein
MLRYVRKLVSVRNANPALRGGEVRTLMRHNHFRQFAYLRSDRSQKAVVALNSGAEARDLAFDVNGEFPNGTLLQDALSGRKVQVADGRVVLKALPSQSGVIMIPARR